MSRETWSDIATSTLPQYPLSSYGVLTVINKAVDEGDPLIVAGYASPQVLDREKHLITREALAEDLPRFMAHPKYRNANLLHSNVQVGEVLPSWTDPVTGKTYETKVDDVGLFAVIKVRTDPYRPPIVDKVIQDIKDGKIASFSISADAPFESRRHECANGTCFWVIDKITFYEITLCEEPVNPDARFTVLAKSVGNIAEYAQSAFCQDGSCALTPLQAASVVSKTLLTKAKPVAAGVAVRAQDTGRILLLQRAHVDGYKDKAAGSWEFPGGGVEEDDSDYFEAAKREWQEETGLVLPYGSVISKWLSSNGKYVGYVYEIPEESDVPIHSDRDHKENPDNLDNEYTETLAWWSIEHFKGNKALREELLTDMKLVMPAITKAYVAKGFISEAGKMLFDDGEEENKAVNKIKLKKPPALRPPTATRPRWTIYRSETIDEFDEGLERESAEHYHTVGGDMEAIANIVRDHLEEDPKYYTNMGEEEEDTLVEADPEKLDRAIAPRAGVSPSAPEVNEESEAYYLNKAATADPFVSGGGFDLITGEDSKKEPKLSEKKKTPALQMPTSPLDPNIIKAIDETLNLAEQVLQLSEGSKLASTFIRKALSNPDNTEVLWLRSSGITNAGDYAFFSTNENNVGEAIKLGTLLKSVAQTAFESGDQALSSSILSLYKRVTKATPISGNKLEALMPSVLSKAEESFGRYGISLITKDDNTVLKLEKLRGYVTSAMSQAVDEVIKTNLSAMLDEINSMIDGYKLNSLVDASQDNEIELDIIKDARAHNTIQNVEKADSLLDAASIKKGGPENLPEEFEEQTIVTQKDTYRGMIAWYPPEELAERLSVSGGEASEDLHVTVVLLGEFTSIDDPEIKKISKVVRSVLSREEPLSGKLSGLGKFMDSTEMVDIALIDVPGLSKLHHKLVSALENVVDLPTEEHDYTPHMTLRYPEDGNKKEIKESSIYTSDIDVMELVFMVEDKVVDKFMLGNA